MNSISDVLAIALQHHQAGNLPQAEQLYQQILQQQPDHVDAIHLLGAIAYQSGNRAQAIALYRQALNINPNLALVHSNLGIVLRLQGDYEQTIYHYQQAITLQPNSAQFHYNLGLVRQEQGNLETAQVYYEKAIALNPNYPEAYHNLGLILNQIGQLEASRTCYQQAITLKSDFGEAHQNLAELLLLMGEFNLGLAEYEWRWQLFPPDQLPTFSTPFWDGSPLEGKTILIYAEQGLGDTFQFIRYASILNQLGARVIAACLPSQIQLIKTVPGIEQVFGLDAELPEFHTQIPLMSLPYILQTNIENIPTEIPYIYSPKSLDFPLLTPSEHHLKVGIVWAGNPGNKNDIRRTSGLQPFLPLLQIPDIAFYSLQVGANSQDLATLPEGICIQDLSPKLCDFAVTAAVINALDLVITIDTSVAHLAGALGQKTWVLLPFIPDWRWLLEREDSPWYPTMRLFRQSSLGNWSEVFARVAKELQQMTQQIANT